MLALKCLIPTFFFFILLDYLWLGHFAKPFYMDNLSSLLLIKGSSINARLLPAFIVYALFLVMVWCIVLPLAGDSLSHALFYGALLGFVVYGVYDMTNLAVLKAWTLEVAIVDWLWGIFLCASCSLLCAFLKSYFK